MKKKAFACVEALGAALDGFDRSKALPADDFETLSVLKKKITYFLRDPDMRHEGVEYEDETGGPALPYSATLRGRYESIADRVRWSIATCALLSEGEIDERLSEVLGGVLGHLRGAERELEAIFPQVIAGGAA